MSYGSIEDQQRATMSALAEVLDEVLNGNDWKQKGRSVGFALLVYPKGENIKGTGQVNYIGNGARADMLLAFKELVARWEGRVPTEGGKA